MRKIKTTATLCLVTATGLAFHASLPDPDQIPTALHAQSPPSVSISLSLQVHFLLLLLLLILHFQTALTAVDYKLALRGLPRTPMSIAAIYLRFICVQLRDF